MRYVALLRGINISGKNKIAMLELKKEFEKLDFFEVLTYINSGNIIFSSNIEDTDIIENNIKLMIQNKFNLNIPVFIITIEKLAMILKNAPDWWGNDNKEIYDNIIFIIPPTTYEEVFLEIGEAKQEYEKISNYKNVIYWSFDLKSYSKTNWIKTANSKINNKVTIRTANTMKKLFELSKTV
jgi:uncharacterized protein (DUF1697 family)